jgi:CBS-domain-containing membrane protein
MKWYQDKTGDTSSKRISGVVILSTGLALLITIGIMSLFKTIADPTTAIQVSNTLMLTGGSLLGVGVIESFGKGK